jgi:hypothetical protein
MKITFLHKIINSSCLFLFQHNVENVIPLGRVSRCDRETNLPLSLCFSEFSLAFVFVPSVSDGVNTSI